jgi:hypothetical protein
MGPFVRDALDAKRMAYNQTPEAMYPDGYLGTINTRRQDRLLDALSNRANQRSYVRGVHKGEQIDQSDYFFPRQLQPTNGIKRQMSTAVPFDTMVLNQRNAPRIDLVPQLTLKEQTMMGAEPGIGRTTQLKKLAPPWR